MFLSLIRFKQKILTNSRIKTISFSCITQINDLRKKKPKQGFTCKNCFCIGLKNILLIIFLELQYITRQIFKKINKQVML